MLELMSIVVVVGLVAFPLFYHQNNKTIAAEITYGIILGFNFNSTDYEHSEDEKKFFREYLLQVHFFFVSVTFSTFKEKSY